MEYNAEQPQNVPQGALLVEHDAEQPQNVPQGVALVEHFAGGEGGAWHEWVSLRPGMTVIMWGGSFIDAVQFEGEKYGGPGGSSAAYTMAEDEQIVAISGRAGVYVDRLCIHFSSGSTLARGGAGGSEFSWNLGTVGRIYKIVVRTGQYVDGIRILSDF
jgi:hypothetical protein